MPITDLYCDFCQEWVEVENPDTDDTCPCCGHVSCLYTEKAMTSRQRTLKRAQWQRKYGAYAWVNGKPIPKRYHPNRPPAPVSGRLVREARELHEEMNRIMVRTLGPILFAWGGSLPAFTPPTPTKKPRGRKTKVALAERNRVYLARLDEQKIQKVT